MCESPGYPELEVLGEGRMGTSALSSPIFPKGH